MNYAQITHEEGYAISALRKLGYSCAASGIITGHLENGGSFETSLLGADPLGVKSTLPTTSAKMGVNAILGFEVSVDWGAIRELLAGVFRSGGGG